MFPGMGMQGPEPLPEHKAQEQFWRELKKLIFFAGTVTVVSVFVKHMETRAHDVLTK